MTRRIAHTVARVHDEPLTDIVAGVWLVTLLLGLLHLPSLFQ